MPSTLAACGVIRRSSTAFPSGWWQTTCARARRSMPCRSPKGWSRSISSADSRTKSGSRGYLIWYVSRPSSFVLRRLRRQSQLQVQFLEAFRRHFGRRVHHQILCSLVHREEDDLADVGFVREEHHDAVDARGGAAVGRCAEPESVEKTAEAFLELSAVIAGDLEGLDHHLRQVVPDSARGQFHPVTDDVVLPRLDGEGVLGLQRLQTALGHGEGIVRELDLPRLLVQLVHREVDDPAELEDVLLDQVQLLADVSASLASEGRKLLGQA